MSRQLNAVPGGHHTVRHIFTATAVLAALLTPAAASGSTTQPSVPLPSAAGSTTEAAPVAARPKKKRKTKVGVSFSAKTVTVGTRATVTGKVKAKGKAKRKRKVVLQQKRSDGWKKVAATKTNRKGKFTVKVPSNWLYSMKTRVVVKKKKRSPKGRSRTTRIAVVPTYTPAGSAKSWSHLNSSLRFRFNPCQKITYRINVGAAPAGTARAIHDSVAMLSEASGLRFKFKGHTKAIYRGLPGGGRWQKDTDLVIGWAHPDQTMLDFSQAHAWGGIEDYVPGRDARGQLGKVIRAGATFDATTRGGWPYAKSLDVLLHELGHAVGLGHVDDPTQIMATGVAGPYIYGAGDLNGLRKQGKQTGCVKTARNFSGDMRSADELDLVLAMP